MSDVLRRVPFYITDEELNNFSYSDEPIHITNVVARINNLINQNTTKKLSYRVVSNWLKVMGLLEVIIRVQGLVRQKGDRLLV